MCTSIKGDLDLVSALDKRNLTERILESPHWADSSKESSTDIRTPDLVESTESWSNMQDHLHEEKQLQEGKQRLNVAWEVEQMKSLLRKKPGTHVPVKNWAKLKALGQVVNTVKANKIKDSNAVSFLLSCPSSNNQEKYLKLINCLLSAMYNMKVKATKNPEVYTEKALKELLESDIDLDEENRPKPRLNIAPKTTVNTKARQTAILRKTTNKLSRFGNIGKGKNIRDLIKLGASKQSVAIRNQISTGKNFKNAPFTFVIICVNILKFLPVSGKNSWLKQITLTLKSLKRHKVAPPASKNQPLYGSGPIVTAKAFSNNTNETPTIFSQNIQARAAIGSRKSNLISK